MQRFDAVLRPGGTEVEGKKHSLCYDHHGVWDDGHPYNGVSHSSVVKVALVKVPTGPVKIQVYADGGDYTQALVWGEAYKVVPKQEGLVSFVPLDEGVELWTKWELTAGKLPG